MRASKGKIWGDLGAAVTLEPVWLTGSRKQPGHHCAVSKLCLFWTVFSLLVVPFFFSPTLLHPASTVAYLWFLLPYDLSSCLASNWPMSLHHLRPLFTFLPLGKLGSIPSKKTQSCFWRGLLNGPAPFYRVQVAKSLAA